MDIKVFVISFNDINSQFIVHHQDDDTHCPMGMGDTRAEAFNNANQFLSNFDEEFIILFD